MKPSRSWQKLPLARVRICWRWTPNIWPTRECWSKKHLPILQLRPIRRWLIFACRSYSPAVWTEFTFNNQVWAPGNYQNEYDGPITLRRALAHSRNIATIKVAESIGFDNVAALWKKFGIGTPPPM